MDVAPHQYEITEVIAPQTAATAFKTILGEAQEDGTVASITLTPNAPITGATATKRTITVVNKGQDGSGNTVIGTLDFITGTNAVEGDELAFTLSGVANATNVAAGDVLELVEAVTSTGLANPGGRVQVVINRR